MARSRASTMIHRLALPSRGVDNPASSGLRFSRREHIQEHETDSGSLRFEVVEAQNFFPDSRTGQSHQTGAFAICDDLFLGPSRELDASSPTDRSSLKSRVLSASIISS